MADEQNTLMSEPTKAFRDMPRGKKFCFIGKALIFFLSGGFIYPTLWID
jgi:hypothetical protein